MTEPHNKSLLPLTSQMELLPSSEMPDSVFFESEQKGEFTGERLAVRNPEKYQAVLSLLAERLGVKTVARILKVSPNTVMVVREREPEAIDTLKKRIAEGAREISRLCVEGLRDDLLDPKTKVSAKDKGIIMGIMTEKAELLSGAPTSRVDITDGHSGHQGLADYLAGLRDAYKTGLGGEKTIKRAEGVEVLDLSPEAEPEDAPDRPGQPQIPDEGQSIGLSPERADGTASNEDHGDLRAGGDEDKDADQNVGQAEHQDSQVVDNKDVKES